MVLVVVEKLKNDEKILKETIELHWNEFKRVPKILTLTNMR